jgi:hypothetical protein
MNLNNIIIIVGIAWFFLTLILVIKNYNLSKRLIEVRNLYDKEYYNQKEKIDTWQRKYQEETAKYINLSNDITLIREKQKFKKQLTEAILNKCLFVPATQKSFLMEIWDKHENYLGDIKPNLTLVVGRPSTYDEIKKSGSIITNNIWTALQHPIIRDREGICALTILVQEIEEDLLLLPQYNLVKEIDVPHPMKTIEQSVAELLSK